MTTGRQVFVKLTYAHTGLTSISLHAIGYTLITSVTIQPWDKIVKLNSVMPLLLYDYNLCINFCMDIIVHTCTDTYDELIIM